MKKIFIIGMSFLLFSTGSHALDCSKIEDSLKRLACFDQKTTGTNNLVNNDIKAFSNEAKDAMKYHFKDPESIVFDDLEIKESQEGNMTLCGHVNGKNSYGGYVGLKPFYFNTERWEIYPEDNKNRFTHYWQKYCQKALFDTKWELKNEGEGPVLHSKNNDGVEFWLSCSEGKNTSINSFLPVGLSQDETWKGKLQSGLHSIVKIAQEDKGFIPIRWEMKKDRKTIKWEIPKRHYKLISNLLSGIHFILMPENGEPSKFYLDGDFQSKLSAYKRLCPNKRFKR